MKKMSIAIVIGFIFLSPLLSHSENLVHEPYRVSIPDNWRKLDLGPRAPFHAYYEASGTFLPATFNNGPVIVTVWIMDIKGSALENAKDFLIRAYSQNPDRVFQNGFTHEEEKMKLKSGEDAYLINTRFYRKQKGLNQSRFDLIAFSKVNKGIVYTISIQYSDPSYQFEKKYWLKKQVKKLYSSFEFR